MNVFFKVDSSIEIGTGHVMRCLVLAGELKRRKFKTTFITRNIKGHLSRIIEEEGYENILLQAASKQNSKQHPPPET